MIDSYKFTLLYITNFISPNGDGVNDTWEVRGIDVTPNATLKLFDRYGKMFVDTTFGGSFVWTGKYMGFNVASGDYWYIIDVRVTESSSTEDLSDTSASETSKDRFENILKFTTVQ